MPLQVLLDTSVLRAGFVSSAGALWRLLLTALTERIIATAFTALMLDYEDILFRPETLQQDDVPAP